MYKAFKRFNPIRSVTRKDSGSVIICFAATGEIKRLRNFRRTKIGNHRVQIKWLGHNYTENMSNRVADTLLNPPDQDSPLNILNALNDDCLFQIFEANALEMSDLAAIGSVCERFNRIIKRIYQRKYSTTTNDDRRFGMLFQYYDHFHCFGSTITALNLTRLHHQPVALGMVAEHCKNLVSFTCDVRDKSTFSDLRKLSARLKELHLYFHLDRVASRDLDRILGEHSSLELLDLHSNNAPVRLPTVMLPHLIDFQMCRIILTSVGDFFLKNKHLKKLKIHDALISFKDSDESFIGLSNLQEFSCIFYEELFELRRKYRREFNGRGHAHGILQKLINCNAPLEKLVVKNPLRMDLALFEICIIRNIKYLDVTLDFGNAGNLVRLRNIFERLDNLKVVRIESEDLTIGNMLEALRASNEKLTMARFQIFISESKILGHGLKNRKNDDNLIALAEFADSRNMEIDVVFKDGESGEKVSLSNEFTYIVL